MNLASSHSDALEIAAALLGGVLAGTAYLIALHHTVRRLAGHGGWAIPAGLTLGRIASIALLLGAAAQRGGIELLAALGGFLLARAACISRLSRSA